MKKLFSILFLVVFLYNLAGYYLVFQYERATVRREMSRRVETHADAQEVLAFPLEKLAEAGISWEDEHEFRWQGHMFDLVKKKVENGILYLYCYSDDREGALLAHLDNHLQKENLVSSQSSSPSNKTLVKALAKDYYFEEWESSATAETACTYSYPHLTEQAVSIYPEPLGQPPRLV